MVEQLIRNQQVVGSSPIFSSIASVSFEAEALCYNYILPDIFCQEVIKNHIFYVNYTILNPQRL